MPDAPRSHRGDPTPLLANATPLRECGLLPEPTITALATGPVPDPFCGVCAALDEARDWMNNDGGAALAEADPERWLVTNNAIERLKRWHDPVGQDSHGFLRPLGRAIERLGWDIADDGLAARNVFFAPGGDGHQVINDLGGDLSWPRCLLLYTLAGWRPEQEGTDPS